MELTPQDTFQHSLPPTPVQTNLETGEDMQHVGTRKHQLGPSPEETPLKRFCGSHISSHDLEELVAPDAAQQERISLDGPVEEDVGVPAPALEDEGIDEADDAWMDLLDFSFIEPTKNSESESYDGIDDSDWAQLLPGTSKSPPTTVVKNMEWESRHDDNFDPALQYSPANATPGSKVPASDEVEELLDEEVDWAMVLSIADKTGSRSHTASSGTMEDRTSVDLTQAQVPFVRPPVPSKVHERPVVPGLSPSTVLRVCFRIGELLSLNAASQRSSQHTIFELFARVNYSTRESLSRTQHFQFMDLFTDRQPFPAGTLKNWKPGSVLDQRAQVFLTGPGPKFLCRVVCTMKKQELSSVGWVVNVTSIEKTTWEEVSWVRQMVARDAADSNSQKSAS